MTKPLRAVTPDERRQAVPTLVEAVESGDVLEMLLAQRRLIATSLANAAENTRPQLNNELNKLHVLIAAEQERRGAEQEAERDASAGTLRRAFNASAI
jgi:hypothetical protein